MNDEREATRVLGVGIAAFGGRGLRGMPGRVWKILVAALNIDLRHEANRARDNGWTLARRAAPWLLAAWAVAVLFAFAVQYRSSLDVFTDYALRLFGGSG